MPTGSSAALVLLTADDAGETLTVQRAAYVSEAQAHDDPRLPPLTQTLDDLRTELADPAVVALGLRERPGGRLLGTVRLRPWPDAREVRELARLAVVPDRQGEGLGSRLMAAAEAHAPDGVRELRLFTGERSSANLRLYAARGYRETHRKSIGPYDLVFMAKPLGRPAAGRAPGPPSDA